MKNNCMILLPIGIVVVTVFLLFSPSRADAAPEDVTTLIEQGTLHIKRAPGSTDGFFGVGITLEGTLDQDIRLLVNGALQETIPRDGIIAIEIDADQSSVSLGTGFSQFQFEGDIGVDVATGGTCFVSSLDLNGNLKLGGSAGRIRVYYRSAVVDGDLTVDGGPGDDLVQQDDGGGALFVTGNLSVDGGAGNESIQLGSSFVGGETTINLGQSSGGEPNFGDRDFLGISFCTLLESLIVTGDEGDDDVFVYYSDIGGDLLIDMGNGADLVALSSITFSDDAIVFVDGGNGNSDELFLGGLPLTSASYSRFETVTP